MHLFHTHCHSHESSTIDHPIVENLKCKGLSPAPLPSDFFIDKDLRPVTNNNLGDYTFQFLSGAERQRFEQRWQAASSQVIFLHRSRLKDEYYRNYLVVGNDYVQASDELEFMINGLNAGDVLVSPEKINALNLARLRENKLKETIVKIRQMGASLGIEKRFSQDLNQRKIARKKLESLGIEIFHVRLLREKIDGSLTKVYLLALHEIFELVSCLQDLAIPHPPATATPVSAQRHMRRRKLRPFPMLAKKLPTQIVGIRVLQPLMPLPLDKTPSQHDRAILDELKHRAKFKDLLRVLESCEAFNGNASLVQEVRNIFPEECKKFASLASTFLTMRELRIHRPGYRLTKRCVEEVATNFDGLHNKWEIFDRELMTADDYTQFELYLKVFENFNLDAADRLSANFHMLDCSDEKELFNWAQVFKNMDRISEIAQTEMAFKLKIEKIIHTLDIVLKNLSFDECERVSIEQLMRGYVEIVRNSGILIGDLRRALKFPLDELAEDAIKSARVAASLRLFVRSQTSEQNFESSKNLLNMFHSQHFTQAGIGFANIFSYRPAWNEIVQQHQVALKSLIAANIKNDAVQEVLAKEHLSGEIFSPIQMRVGRYALMLSDCKFPDIQLAKSAMANAHLLAEKVNRAVRLPSNIGSI